MLLAPMTSTMLEARAAREDVFSRQRHLEGLLARRLVEVRRLDLSDP